jgi:hypothetical protein
MLDNFLNLDPVGFEHHHHLNSPTREINYQGYYGMTVPFSVALSYDWLIKEMRTGNTQYGLTAVEDYKIRDNLAMFACLTLQRQADPYSFTIDSNGFDDGMWSTAWLAAAQVVSMVMPNYESELYGTSGAPKGQHGALHTWAPYPDHPMTWWDACADRNATIYGYPNMARRSGYWGLLDENLTFNSRPAYWDNHLMGWIYYTMANVRCNYDGVRFPHWEQAFDRAIDGTLASASNSTEGPIKHHSALLVNRHFPNLAGRERSNLLQGSAVNEKTLSNSIWTHSALTLCIYQYDWDR